MSSTLSLREGVTIVVEGADNTHEYTGLGRRVLHDAYLATVDGLGLELDEPVDDLLPIRTEGVEGEACIVCGGDMSGCF